MKVNINIEAQGTFGTRLVIFSLFCLGGFISGEQGKSTQMAELQSPDM